MQFHFIYLAAAHKNMNTKEACDSVLYIICFVISTWQIVVAVFLGVHVGSARQAIGVL